MTLNNKNVKTKTITTMTGILIGLIMLSPMTIFSNVIAQPQNMSINPSEVEKMLPTALSDIQLAKVKQIALSHSEVQNLLKGKHYEFTSTDFIGNVKTSPVIWYPEIHINVSNTTEITVAVNQATNSVVSIGTYKLERTHGPISPSNPNQGSTTGASFAADYIGGTTTVKGIYMTSTAPGFSSSGTNIGSYFLVNGIETGADYTKACTSANYYANYFAQAGFGYNTTKGFPTWADTQTNCFTQHPNLAYVSGHSYVFYVMVKASGSWYIYGIDTNGSGMAFTHLSPVIQNSSMFNDIDTSVWFENHNTSSNSGWYGQFTGSPSATSIYLNSAGSWVNWSSSDSVKIIQDCSGVNHSDTHGVMSGNLASGGTATWSLSTMSQYYNC